MVINHASFVEEEEGEEDQAQEMLAPQAPQANAAAILTFLSSVCFIFLLRLHGRKRRTMT